MSRAITTDAESPIWPSNAVDKRPPGPQPASRSGRKRYSVPRELDDNIHMPSYHIEEWERKCTLDLLPEASKGYVTPCVKCVFEEKVPKKPTSAIAGTTTLHEMSKLHPKKRWLIRYMQEQNISQF